jgi:dolichyl-phosphate-mannose-protein mannosyltransferase
MMDIAASARSRIVGIVGIVAAMVYLVPFVPRGWIPHDEGMLGEAADRVLHGAVPHIDYEEPYSGGLSWLYAAVFRFKGVDLLHVRWLLFGGACLAVWLVYALARRHLTPPGAAFAAWVALVWSFPNYFAGLPSWWLLICALACIWAFTRHVETGHWAFIALAGLAAGLAVAVKQTGIYLIIALALSIAYRAGPALARWSIAIATAVCAMLILQSRILDAEGVYLFCPLAGCALALMVPQRDRSPSDRSFGTMLVAGGAAALPMVALMAPYVVRGRMWDFVNGTLLVPQKRLAFASASMPSGWYALTAIPLIVLVFVEPRQRWLARSRIATGAVWAVAVLLPLAALRSAASYQAIWQSARAFAAFLPLGIVWRVTSGDTRDPERATLFMAASTLAWMSLNQFPFAVPIYFSYVAPLAVVAAIAVARRGGAQRCDAMPAWAALLVLFAVLSANRGYVENLGVAHEVRRFDAPLDLPRAHLAVGRADAAIYQGLSALVRTSFRGGVFFAAPDCPQVYFLNGFVNPSGVLFDFFGDTDEDNAAKWINANMIVVNHAPHFSPRASERLLNLLRSEFVHGESVGPFEVRWR